MRPIRIPENCSNVSHGLYRAMHIFKSYQDRLPSLLSHWRMTNMNQFGVPPVSLGE